MTVVTDAGPVMALAKLDLLGLLGPLYGQVLIPPQVHQEVVVWGAAGSHTDAFAARRAVEAGQLAVAELGAVPSELAIPGIDLGEAQSIALALQRSADLLLLDDLVARRVAAERGLQVKGTLGVLVAGYRAGQLSWSDLQTRLAEMDRRSDIWISSSLCAAVLEALRQERGEPRGQDR